MATKRNARVLSYGLLLFGAAWAAALASSACSDDQDDCALNPSLGCGPYETATGGSGGNGGDGGGGGVPAGCVPSEADGPVGESCGVFVSVSGSDDAGNGSQGAPYATIGKGLTEAGGQPVYVCVGDYAEAVSIAAAVDLFGGLDCSSWAYTETLTRLNGPVDEIALRVESTAGGTQIVDFAITAADASEPGGSSIAVLVDQAEVELERCELTAGAGADGAAGDTPPDRGQDGLIGGDGVDGCVSSASVDAAAPVTVTCSVGGTSTGGRGGAGEANLNGGPGTPGSSNPEVSTPANNGGAGQTTSTPPANGTIGEPGAPGSAGDGATGIGEISGTGYAGVVGQAGQSAGSPGQGGGGGGGARGSEACSTASNAGPAGAGGGTGSDGQEGGNGAGGGQLGTGNSYNSGGGGAGGKGGRGGAAGGGLGGHSLGIAFAGTAPTTTDTTITASAEGNGGAGGDAGENDGNVGGVGAPGQSCQTLDFGTEDCVNS